MMKWIDRAIGIDLGTTNSASAMLAPSGETLLLAEDEHGRAVVPSAVGYDLDGHGLITGFTAWQRRHLEPPPALSVKRKMGLEQEVELGPLLLTPAEISAEILRAQQVQMVRALQRQGLPHLLVQRAVITVPAYFDAPQIEATREAGALAELEVLALLQEPTAACMYAAWKRDIQDGVFLVYDLGGGTLDVSVIRLLYGEYQVLGIHGDNYLGGDDFDRRLAEFFRQHLVARGYALDFDIQERSQDRARFDRLRQLARRTKEGLSREEVVFINEQELFEDDAGQMVSLELEFSRRQWSEMMEDLLDSSIRCCEEALEKARECSAIALNDVDYILLVGGSTKSPMVAEKVQRELCGVGKAKASRPISEAPDSCVALGAAIHAANLGGVEFGDDERQLSVRISSPLASRSQQTRLVGKVRGRGAAALTTALLKDDLGTTLGVESLGEGQSFLFSKVNLAEQGRNELSLELLTESGATRAEFGIPMHADADLKQAGSALSNPAVLAKSLYLEVKRRASLGRALLIRRGSTLPAKESFVFATADQSGIVVLTLLQNHFPIRTIHIEVPKDTPVGAPVSLEVEVNEKMEITAKGEVEGQSYWAQLKPPPEQGIRKWEEIEALIEQSHELGARLWGNEARAFKRETPFLLASIREAAKTDPDKLQVLVNRLVELLKTFEGTPTKELSPGFDRFERVLDRVRRIVYMREQLMGLSFEAWQAKLEELHEHASKVFDARDQKGWSKAYTQLQALYESVTQEETQFLHTDSLEHVEHLYELAKYKLALLLAKRADLVLPQSSELGRLWRHHLEEIDAQLQAQAVAPLERIKPAASKEIRLELLAVLALLKQLDRRVEQLPSLGVVESR